MKDDVSRLTGDIGGVGLLHSECEREPGVAEEKGKKKGKKIKKSGLLLTAATRYQTM